MQTGDSIRATSLTRPARWEASGKEEDGRALHADGVTPGSGRGAVIASNRVGIFTPFYIRSIWDAILGNIAYLNR